MEDADGDEVDLELEEARKWKPEREMQKKSPLVLVDGYNVLYAWPRMRPLLEDNNFHEARETLIRECAKMAQMRKWKIRVVFDAYLLRQKLSPGAYTVQSSSDTLAGEGEGGPPVLDVLRTDYSTENKAIESVFRGELANAAGVDESSIRFQDTHLSRVKFQRRQGIDIVYTPNRADDYIKEKQREAVRESEREVFVVSNDNDVLADSSRTSARMMTSTEFVRRIELPHHFDLDYALLQYESRQGIVANVPGGSDQEDFGKSSGSSRLPSLRRRSGLPSEGDKPSPSPPEESTKKLREELAESLGGLLTQQSQQQQPWVQSGVSKNSFKKVETLLFHRESAGSSSTSSSYPSPYYSPTVTDYFLEDSSFAKGSTSDGPPSLSSSSDEVEDPAGKEVGREKSEELGEAVDETDDWDDWTEKSLQALSTALMKEKKGVVTVLGSDSSQSTSVSSASVEGDESSEKGEMKKKSLLEEWGEELGEGEWGGGDFAFPPEREEEEKVSFEEETRKIEEMKLREEERRKNAAKNLYQITQASTLAELRPEKGITSVKERKIHPSRQKGRNKKKKEDDSVITEKDFYLPPVDLKRLEQQNMDFEEKRRTRRLSRGISSVQRPPSSPIITGKRTSVFSSPHPDSRGTDSFSAWVDTKEAEKVFPDETSRDFWSDFLGPSDLSSSPSSSPSEEGEEDEGYTQRKARRKRLVGGWLSYGDDEDE
uniref:Uncharacterized protein n=1 Tax=Chromera velia CCMP2878 TaxID=1169474 RepID=A0A0G4I7N2_9ALVE|eukprot:Cvel_11725.t1-p1 / transcript=Cvel_11725.t1 / gene=Cvel_11725 / organism=Chromera_velia_CCMP2878 / gene_product=hypothetical protein / transcript_product=hypothetical protein / location=Cvel_scaffold744:28685-32943(+) / protein_length=712 / sequence_SO=supercontig / SO=protein_coding / is_pseudo=false